MFVGWAWSRPGLALAVCGLIPGWSQGGVNHWTLRHPASETNAVVGLAVDPSQPRTLYLATLQGFFRSDDQGLNWTLINPEGLGRGIQPVPQSAPTKLFAVDGTGTLTSSDGGQSWSSPSGSPQWFTFFDGDSLLGIVPMGDEVALYASTACCILPDSVPTDFRTWRSVDSGVAFAEITDQVGFSTSLAFDPAEPVSLYLASDRGIFQSQNGGENWRRIGGIGLPTGVGIAAIAVDPRFQPGLLLAGAGTGEVFASSDGGERWSGFGRLPGAMLELLVSSAADHSSYYARTNTGIFADFQGEARWLPIRRQAPESAISFLKLASTSEGSLPTLFSVVDDQLEHFQPVFRYFPQIGDGQTGLVGFQTSLLANNAGDETFLQVEFFDSAGAALAVDLGEEEPVSSLSLVLERGESREFQARVGAVLRVGYARVLAGSALGGTAIFTRTDIPSGQVLYEAGVPLTNSLTDFSISVDSTGLRDSGLALVNASSQEARLLLRLYDEAFQLVATEEMALAAGGHLARFVFELFPQAQEEAREMKGTLTVASDQPLAAVTLRQNEDPARSFPDFVPTLTVFPVIPGRANGSP